MFVTYFFRAKYNDYCSENYANGHCDEGCNNLACVWDGLDCEKSDHDKSEKTLPGVLVSNFLIHCFISLSCIPLAAFWFMMVLVMCSEILNAATDCT